MYQLNKVVYDGQCVPARDAADGEVCRVAVTHERNGFVVWYGRASDHDVVQYTPADEQAIFWGEDSRERAIESAVMRCAKFHKAHERRKAGK
jgi:hypothetical protein